MVANITCLADITPYKDVNKLLTYFAQNITSIFGQDLVAIYLLGSLTYNDFNHSKSDIDLAVIISNNGKLLEEICAIRSLHRRIKTKYSAWAGRLECSYLPVDMLTNSYPPLSPRPYYNNNIFFAEAHYGHEWLINKYLLYQHGISLIGPDFKKLIEEVNIQEVQKACIRDLFEEWKPKMADAKWLSSDYHRSYIILNLCRILYTIVQHPTGSKTIAATWVKNEFGSQWQNLIETAEQWQPYKEMTGEGETMRFIKFVVEEVSKKQLYRRNFKESASSQFAMVQAY